MRLLLFFDLPMDTAEGRREYSRFRKYLIKNGFIMLQKSVYCKLAVNQGSADALTEAVRRNRPPEGVIQTLLITEKQYSRMEFILGETHGDVLDSDERFLEL